MLLHHRNWPVLPPNGRAQGQPGAGVDPLSDGTGVAPAHVPTLPAATSAFNLTLCHPICPLSPVLGLHCVWEPGPQGLYYSNHQSLSWRNSIRQTKQILSPKVGFLLILEDRSLASNLRSFSASSWTSGFMLPQPGIICVARFDLRYHCFTKS